MKANEPNTHLLGHGTLISVFVQKDDFYEQDLPIAFWVLPFSSLHWPILVLFYALLVQWSMFPLNNIFKRSECNGYSQSRLITWLLYHKWYKTQVITCPTTRKWAIIRVLVSRLKVELLKFIINFITWLLLSLGLDLVLLALLTNVVSGPRYTKYCSSYDINRFIFH